MNRKQKITIVVGAAVIALLVLFPMWQVERAKAPPWMRQEQQAEVRMRVRWVGSPATVTEEVEGQVCFWHDFRNKYTMKGDEVPAPELRHEGVCGRVEYHYTVSLGWTALLVVAALALTVAAVLALKDRKPKA